MDEPPSHHAPPEFAAGPARRRPSARVIIPVVGALAAVGLGTVVAMGIFRQDPADDTPPPAAEGGLKIELGNAQGGDQIDPARPLRCFVGGKMVGELTVAACAQRNGVAAQNLDVGIDAAGELAAVVAMPEPLPQPEFAEAPPQPEPVADAYVPEAAPAAPAGPAGECMRHSGGEWRSLGDAVGLDTCVQILFTGRCESAGSASYGRWNGQTLRLVTGRVEIAPDGANFRTFAEQDASCMLP